jgi:hypothetical protein
MTDVECDLCHETRPLAAHPTRIEVSDFFSVAPPPTFSHPADSKTPSHLSRYIHAIVKILWEGFDPLGIT